MHLQRKTISAAAGCLVAFAAAAAPFAGQRSAAPAPSPAQATYADIKDTLGFVPGMFKAFPEIGIAGAWAEFKSVQLNPQTKLDGKTKELLGLAVASQIPCQYCVYFHTAAAKLNGASDEEVREAVAMAAITRHWSTVLNGSQMDMQVFKRETDEILRAAAAKKSQPAH